MLKMITYKYNNLEFTEGNPKCVPAYVLSSPSVAPERRKRMQNRENNLTLNDVTQRVKEGIYNKYGFYLNEGNLYNICKTELEEQYKHINTSKTWINNASFLTVCTLKIL